MTIKELKEILDKYDDSSEVIINYDCDDCYYGIYNYKLTSNEIIPFEGDLLINLTRI